LIEIWYEAPMEGSVFSKQKERWATQAQLTEPLVLNNSKLKSY
jgi:hypothetical protein